MAGRSVQSEEAKRFANRSLRAAEKGLIGIGGAAGLTAASYAVNRWGIPIDPMVGQAVGAFVVGSALGAAFRFVTVRVPSLARALVSL